MISFLLFLFFSSHDSLELDVCNKVCFVVTVFINAVIVLLFIQKLRIMVGELIFRKARLFLYRNSSFFSRIGKKNFRVGDKN